MKRFFKLFLFGGVFTLLLTGCNVAKSEIEIDETILSSLPEEARPIALDKMIRLAKDANDINHMTFMDIVTNRHDDIIVIIIIIIIAVSILFLVFMLLRAHSRNLRIGYDNLNRLLEKDAASLPSAEVIELFTANNKSKKRKPYIFDATFIGIGIGTFLWGLFVKEDWIMGIGAMIFFFGLMRLLIRLFLDRREKK